MQLDVISYNDLEDQTALKILTSALLQKGIVGIQHVPTFQEKSRAYVKAAQQFASLPESVKQQYAPNRDAEETEGYEFGAEWFKDEKGEWQIDDKKASYYAFVPDQPKNKWPHEVDLKTPYLALGELIFATGKKVLRAMGLDETVGIHHDGLQGYGRMLHYHKEGDQTNHNPNWCGAHLDHGVFTGLMPAYYFRDGVEIEEPAEAGLYIVPTQGQQFEKINAADKSILLFQVGEFGQLASHDRIRATKHIVKKAYGSIERFAFALFYNAALDAVIYPKSELTEDARYQENKLADGGITYDKWQIASFARYRAR